MAGMPPPTPPSPGGLPPGAPPPMPLPAPPIPPMPPLPPKKHHKRGAHSDKKHQHDTGRHLNPRGKSMKD